MLIMCSLKTGLNLSTSFPTGTIVGPSDNNSVFIVVESSGTELSVDCSVCSNKHETFDYCFT